MASMSAQLLPLLQGPTRLAVGVLSGAAAADLLLGPTARCYVYRPPYDDKAFQSVYGSQRERELASSKPKRPVGQAALARLSTPSHIALTFGRNVGIAVLITFNRWLVAAVEEMDAAEEEGREPETPPLQLEELGAACTRGAINACLDLAVQATRSMLDAEAVKHLPAGLAKKLVKDLRLSVQRKGALPWYARTVRVAKTAAFSEATWWAADFAVSCAMEVYAAARKSAGTWAQRVQRLLLRCGLHAARAAMVLAAVSIGYGVGSAAPGLRSLTTWACSMVASFLVNGYMIAFINRLAPLAPPGGAGGAPAGSSGAAVAPVPPAPAAAGSHAGFVMVGQQVHPAAVAAMAAAAAAGGARAGDPGAANGVAEHAVQANAAEAEEAAAAGAEEAEGGARAAGAAAAQDAAAPPAAAGVPPPLPVQHQDAGVQAGAPPGAAEPPIPAPQQRRVVGGPRLPDRPPRRNAAAGPGPGADAAAAAVAAAAPLAPPPAAPHTPQFRDQRAPTPAGDSEEAEARAAASGSGAAASPAGTSSAGAAGDASASASSSANSEAPAAASPAQAANPANPAAVAAALAAEAAEAEPGAGEAAAPAAGGLAEEAEGLGLAGAVAAA